MSQDPINLEHAHTAPPWDEARDAFPCDIQALATHRHTLQPVNGVLSPPGARP